MAVLRRTDQRGGSRNTAEGPPGAESSEPVLHTSSVEKTQMITDTV